MKIEEVNSRAWDREEKEGSWWSKIVEKEEVEKAKKGELNLRVTTSRFIPHSWCERLEGKDVLNLCGGGGQQTPLLAAYGCRVTSLDISPCQIEQDRKSLEMYSLNARTLLGSVLSIPFDDGEFDAIVNPISLNFVDDLEKAYSEISRVLRRGGYLMMGIANPALYLFDEKKQQKKLVVKYTLPFSSTVSLSKKEVARKEATHDTLEFSHTLDSIIGSMLRRGFVLEDFFSDKALSEPTDSFVHDCFLAFLFRKS